MSRAIKIFFVLVTSLFKKRRSALDRFSVDSRVSFFEADLRIANNSVYHFYFELPRWQCIFESDLFHFVKKHKAYPLVATQNIKIFRPLKRFQKFTVSGRVFYWDEKWIYFQQKIESHGELIAVGVVKGLMRNRERKIPTRELFEKLNLDFTQPQISQTLMDWIAVEDEALKLMISV